MAKVALQKTREVTGERKARDIAPRLTVYRDGLAKLTTSARVQLGNTESVHILHDSENSNVIYLSTSGGFPHKMGKQGTFSAASLWRHIGRPDHPVHIDLTADADGDLVGDLNTAVHGENAAPRGPRAAKVAASEGAPAVGSANGTVDPVAPASTTTSGPVASGPSDTSHSDDEDEDEDEDYDSEDDDIEAVKVAAGIGNSKKSK